MRDYMRQRRVLLPDRPLLERARKRARMLGVPFEIGSEHVVIPEYCPVLGIPLKIGGPRSDQSPSLDRIVPSRGYVPGNIRVISDRANRLKGGRTHADLSRLAATAPPELRSDYERVAEYVHREALLRRIGLSISRPRSSDLRQLVTIIDRAFSTGLPSSTHARSA